MNSILLFAQNAPHPSFRHYTTDNGLASPEVYHILQDKKGYIWIATDNGVSRFDGYEFRNYSMKEGLVENVIFMMQLDSLDRLWMQAMNGRLYFFHNGTIHPYWNNQVIDSFINKSDNKGFIVEGAGEMVHYASLFQGIISIAKDGSYTSKNYVEPFVREVFERKGMVINSISQKISSDEVDTYLKSLSKRKQSSPIYLSSAKENWLLRDLSFPQKNNSYNFEAFHLGLNKYLLKNFSEISFINNGKVIWRNNFPERIIHARLMKNGQLFIGLDAEKGLRVYNSLDAFSRKEGFTWMSGETISYIMEGEDGVNWFATNNNGIYNSYSDAITVFDKETGLTDDKVTALTIKNENEIYVGLYNGEVWKLDYKKGKVTAFPELPFYSLIKDLYFEPKTQRLWVGRGMLFYFENEKWLTLNSNTRKRKSIIASRITESPDKKHLWLGSHSGFECINLNKVYVENINRNLMRTYIVREDFQGRVWVGQTTGLFEWKNNTLYQCDTINPLFSLRVEDIALMPDSTLVVATKGGGLVFWKGEKMEQISTANGLTADMLECVYVDEKGTVWAGTLNGLNRITGSFEKREVKQITVSNGLPSNEINRISSLGDQVWLATNRGLVCFNNKNISHLSPKPVFGSVLANNDTLDLENALELASHQNNLGIHFYAINYRMDGKIPYRYRINNGDWVETMNRSLNFMSLPPGKRIFEVQAQNEDNKWSESSSLEIVIHPPWWATWWASSGALLFALFLFFTIYKYRTGQLKKANKIQLQIAELERSALQAQMNPHFIFNCLNSIQNFILQNEKDSAILYLGSFASLVRSMLNASVSGKIPLDEEIKLLNNYLELEKLRFKKRINYEIKTAKGMNLFEIRIPPLLVQPYVENALVHGMSGKTNGGKVDVLFEEKDDFLEVSILDNGGGINTSVEGQSNPKQYKSFGMSITKNRLELLAHNKEENPVSTTTLYNEKNEIVGTKVIIRIGIEHGNI